MTDEQKQAVERLEKSAADMVQPQRMDTVKAVGNDIQTLLKAVRENEKIEARLEYLITSGDSVRFRSNNMSEGWVVDDKLARWTAQTYATPAEALDAAISQSGVKEGQQ